jgi:hypothetical protein
MSRLATAFCLTASVCLPQSPSTDPFLGGLDRIAQQQLDDRERAIATIRTPGRCGSPQGDGAGQADRAHWRSANVQRPAQYVETCLRLVQFSAIVIENGKAASL